jgi:hypothetical protein
MQFVKPILFREAIEKLDVKTIVAAGLDSAQWARVPAALRERAYFSSRVESAHFLQKTKDWLGDFLSGAREKVTRPDGTETTALKMGSRADFVKEAQDFAIENNMGPLDPEDEGTIKDIRTERRLELIYDVQTQSAERYGYWKQGMDPDVLNEFPAMRLVRIRELIDPKSERVFHRDAEGVARLKTDVGYWKALNQDFGVPWGPWGWGCGHDVEDVDRDEAEALGLIEPGQELEPVPGEFNADLEASTEGMDPEIAGLLGEFVKSEGGVSLP